ncbi:MAG: ankyrin repeat domain-containing protein [Puniceicoccales bacterium]|jgi:ankyrin repeat protein|nr:ankyrin repeat domain-containing protein [Puniceicoccales bacterium]
MGENYREIFNLIIRRRNRDWDLRNVNGETALLLSVRLGRMEAVRVLAYIVDPNIPDVN